jgi:predicted AlkP superfamily phosphohydrolase/phosphomutase
VAKPRLMMLALDAFEPWLIEDWCSDGTLPNIAALRAQGRYGPVRSWAANLPGSVWPSFASMSDPSEHGVWEFMQWDPAGMRFRRTTADWLGFDVFWHRLAERGISSVVFDMPFEFNRRSGPNVAEAHGWGLHYEVTEVASNPPGLMAELQRQFGKSPVGPDVLGPKTRKALAGELEGLMVSARRRVAIVEHLAQRFEWRILLAPFAETHRTGHWFWTERSTGTPLEGLRRVAQLIDGELPRLRALLGPDDILMLFGLHGMGTNHDIDRFTEPLWEYFEPADSAPARRFDPVRIANRGLPPGLRRRLSAALSTRMRDRLLAHALAAGRDWSKTRLIFNMPDGRILLRLNQQGREAGGIVPAARREGELARVRDTLLGAVNAFGEPAFNGVHRPDQVYSGPRLDMLPDLVGLIHQRPIGDFLGMPDGRRVHAPWRGWRDADHRAEGFYLQVGGGIEKGSTGPAIAIEDLARVACASIGVTV